MKKIILIVVLFSKISFFGQNLTIEPIQRNSVNFESQNFFGYDGFGNYFYENENVFYKKNNTTIFQYQNVSYGKLKKVDFQNPLKILLFYENFNTVILLDNQLNEIQKINFSNLNFSVETSIIAAAIGISGQNKLWVFNSNEQRIGLFDLATQNYKNVSIPIKKPIKYYQTNFNSFRWIDVENNLFSCTIYGEIALEGKVDNYNQIQILDTKDLLYSIQNELFYKNRKTNKMYKIEIVEKSFEKFYYNDQILTIFTKKGITNYKIILP